MELRIVFFLGALQLLASNANPFDSRNFCIPPASPAHGKVSFGRGHVITRYTCNSGYKLIGATVAVCVAGKWSARTPKCVPTKKHMGGSRDISGDRIRDDKDPMDLELKDQQIVTAYSPPDVSVLHGKSKPKNRNKSRRKKGRKRKNGRKRNRRKNRRKGLKKKDKSQVGNPENPTDIGESSIKSTLDGTIKKVNKKKRKGRRRRKKNRSRKNKAERKARKGKNGKRNRKRKRKNRNNQEKKEVPVTTTEAYSRFEENDIRAPVSIPPTERRTPDKSPILYPIKVPERYDESQKSSAQPKPTEKVIKKTKKKTFHDNSVQYAIPEPENTPAPDVNKFQIKPKPKDLLQNIIERMKNRGKINTSNLIDDILLLKSNSRPDQKMKSKNEVGFTEKPNISNEITDYEADYEALPDNYVDPYATKDGAMIPQTINPANDSTIVEMLPEGYPTLESRQENEVAKDRFVEQENIDFSVLDTSCTISEIDSLYLPPPRVKNGHVTAYISVTNPAKPNNVYVEANYDCNFGYQLIEQTNSRLFCHQNTWVGLLPECQPYTVTDQGGCGEENGGCEHICHQKADTSLSCSCYRGFTLVEDKVSCRDVDECAVDNGGCDGACFNKLGSFQCYCPKGYRISTNGKSCLDKNECILRNGHGPCQDTCHNTEGSYFCTCDSHPGIKLAKDNHTCEDVNECDNGNGGCSHICLNTFGQTFCGCPEGFVLGMDWKTCEDINECEYDDVSKSCEHGCLNTPGSFKCMDPQSSVKEKSCDKGFVLNEDTQDCEDINECDLEKLRCSHTCENTFGSAFCTCPDGWTLGGDGMTCGDIDECKMRNPCSDECVNTNGSYSCRCPEGFKLGPDLLTCVDINECTVDNGGCEHLCRNSPGSYYCECHDGFIPEENGLCKDIDECQIDNGRCHQICTNTIGTFYCTCKTGYELDGGNSSCIDVNECEEEVPCEYHCQNTDGGFSCSCPDGFILDGDMSSCVDIDECDSNNLCSEFCSNQNGSYVCSCREGWMLHDDDHSCIDINECDGDTDCSHSCMNTNGSYVCTCSEGMELMTEGTKYENRHKCIDIDECNDNNGNCSDICHNFEGYHECSCPDGYKINSDVPSTCEDIDECGKDNGGCSHKCFNEPGSFHCECPRRLQLREDGKTCGDVDECLVNNGGCSHICNNLPNSYECSCPNGWELDMDYYGDYDDDSFPWKNCIDFNECEILNGGCSHNCTNTEGSFKCSCPSGFELLHGYSCEDIDECHNELNNCSHDCMNLPGSFKCICPQGFELVNTTRCIDVNECLSDNGGCNHQCTNTIGSRTCTCDKGYVLESDDLTCSDLNECGQLNGGCSHECRNSHGDFVCLCPKGMKLDIDDITCIDINECDLGECSHFCENTVSSYLCSCPEGLTLGLDGKTCSDFNECKNDNAGCSHQCVNKEGDYLCLCPVGWTLGQDEHTCEDFDECEDNNGGCSGACQNTEGGFICSCDKGFSLGIDNATCHDIDECAIENGGCESTCINTRGSFRCNCGSGLHLHHDLSSCKDIDECLVANGGCSHECQNNHGSFECLCPSGYVVDVDGMTCVDIDECQAHKCDHQCINTPGSFYCKCREGFAPHPDSSHQCHDVDECEEGSSECSQHCFNEIGSYRCACGDGYVLQDDLKTCKEKQIFCPLIIAPLYGTMSCSHEPVEGIYPAGTVCLFVCSNGKILDGESSSLCTKEGVWTNEPTECKAAKCSGLTPIDNGVLAPRRCLLGTSVAGQHCYLTCNAGYRVSGNPVRTCTTGGEWLPKDVTPYCEPASLKPYIQCPKDLVVDLAPHQSVAYVRIPQPKSNVDWYSKVESERYVSARDRNTDDSRFVKGSPSWAKDLEADLPSGRTKVSFTARSPISEAIATCSFIVFVKDSENPQVFGCPKSFKLFTNYGDSTVDVSWKEPIFKDNVEIMHVYKSMKPGLKLGIGTYPVHYIAVDPQGNRAKCSFVITVEAAQLAQGAYPSNKVWVVCQDMNGGKPMAISAWHVPQGCTVVKPSNNVLRAPWGSTRTHSEAPSVMNAPTTSPRTIVEPTPRVSVYDALAISNGRSANSGAASPDHGNTATALSASEDYAGSHSPIDSFYGRSNPFSHLLQNSHSYAVAHARSGKQGSAAYAQTKSDDSTKALAHARARVYNYG